MCIQRKNIIDHLSTKSIKRKEEAKTDKILVIEIEIDHSVEIDEDKTLDLNIADKPQDRCKQCGCDNRTGSYRCQKYDNRGNSRDRGRVNFRRNFSNERNDSRDSNRSRTWERSLTPRRNERRYSPNANLGTRKRSTF